MNIWWLGTVVAATLGCPVVALAAVRLRRERLACQAVLVELRQLGDGSAPTCIENAVLGR